MKPILKLTPVLVKAIQEQQTIIENLKSRLEILESNWCPSLSSISAWASFCVINSLLKLDIIENLIPAIKLFLRSD